MAMTNRLLLFLSWFLSLFGKSLTGISWRCPTEEMVSSDYGCYLFHAGTLSFSDAESYCWSVGTTLVWIRSQDEMIYLAGQALQKPQVTAWLIGLHTSSEEKDLTRYYWSSGHKVTFTAWSDLEPDHYGNEKCVTMELKFAYGWATVPCNQQWSFICKSDPPFFRLKNPILLGILGVITIILIILIFVLCTMRNRPPATCEDHVYCTRGSASAANKDGDREAFILDHVPSSPTAPPVDDRYTSLPPVPPYVRQNSRNEPIDHVYEDVDGHRRMARMRSGEATTPTSPDAPHPTNPYLMWA